MSQDYRWHVERAKTILAQHPEIRDYYRPWPASALFIVALGAAQWAMAAWMGQQPWWVVGLVAFFFGQFLLHALASFIHEAAHNRIFRSNRGNMVALFLIEFGTLSWAKSLEYVAKHNPSHHRYLNDYVRDYEWWDAPRVERLKNRKSWRLFESVMHLLPLGVVVTEFIENRLVSDDNRRHFSRRDLQPWFKYTLLATSLSGYLLAGYLFGWTATLYFLWTVSIMVGNWGITFKGQSIAEHDVTKQGKTFSSYGWQNRLFFNTGYHDEHHTFPQVPWVYLPKVRKIAWRDFQNDSGRSYVGWWWQWARSLFLPERFNRYRSGVGSVISR